MGFARGAPFNLRREKTQSEMPLFFCFAYLNQTEDFFLQECFYPKDTQYNISSANQRKISNLRIV